MGSTSAKPPEHICLFILMLPLGVESVGLPNAIAELLRRNPPASISVSTAGSGQVKLGSSAGIAGRSGVTGAPDGL